ncbi:MAG: methyl-accepting chemotaxis protein [Negativicutes bacterium]|nr:methyl-accepting chemotaxis protein [Negativicutes bacterium]
MKSIQAKLTVSVLVVFFIALSALGGLNYWKARTIITNSVTEDIQYIAVSSSRDVGDWLEARKAMIQTIAEAPAVKKGDVEALLPLLINVHKANKEFEAIGYTFPSGLTYNSLGLKFDDLSQREYIQRSLKGEVYVSDPMVSRSTGQLFVAVSAPVKVDGKVTGVIFGAIYLDEVVKKVLDVKVGQTGYAFVAQGDGLRIIHPDKEMAMKSNPLKDEKTEPDQKKLAESMTKKEKGIALLASTQGVSKYYAYAPVSGTSWSLAVSVPVTEVTGEVSALTTVSVTTIIIVLILTSIIITWYARRLARPIREIEAVANRIAAGDITLTQLGVTGNDEIGRLGHSFEQMTDNLRRLINRILGATEQVAAAAEEMTASSEQSAQATNQVAGAVAQTAQGTERQAAAVTKAMGVVERIVAGAQQEAANTTHAVDMTRMAVTAAEDGNDSVETAISQMNQIQVTVDDSAKVVTELGERSKEIGKIVETIANIAGQTNLLALNAAIEAARAGEQGRGFAVVAEEVRKLAEDSQEAAKQIALLIQEIRAKTDTAVLAMTNGTVEVKKGTEVVDKAGAAFRNIVSQVKEVAGIAQGTSEGLAKLAAQSAQVLTAMQEIDTASRDIAGQAENISASTEEQSASIEEIASSSQELAKLAETLQSAVRQFKI